MLSTALYDVMAHTTTRLKLSELSGHLLCVVCGGYLIDATTITECLHSFCRTCIVRHFEKSKTCPRCQTVVHKTKPLLNLRSDRTLQTLVYKLVPGLFQNEMQKRRKFYASNPHAVPMSEEDRGDMEDNHVIYTEDEKISLCLEHCDRLPGAPVVDKLAVNNNSSKEVNRRYLLCPALFTVAHLKKFIRHKFDLNPCYQVEIVHTNVSLKDACTLMDIANIYSWKRVEPLRLYYIVFDTTQLSLDLPEPTDKPIITTTLRIPPSKKRQRKTLVSKSPKSPKVGLVKSRRFKPPRPKTPKSKKCVASIDVIETREIKANATVSKPSSTEDEEPLAVLKDKMDNANQAKSKGVTVVETVCVNGKDSLIPKGPTSPPKEKDCVDNIAETKQTVILEKDTKDISKKLPVGESSKNEAKKNSTTVLKSPNPSGITAKVVSKASTQEEAKKPLRVPPLKVVKSPAKSKLKCTPSILRGNDKSTAKWLNMLELKTKESDKAACKRKELRQNSSGEKVSDKAEKTGNKSKDKAKSEKIKSQITKSVAKTVDKLLQKVLDKSDDKPLDNQRTKIVDKTAEKEAAMDTAKATEKSVTEDKPLPENTQPVGSPNAADNTKTVDILMDKSVDKADCQCDSQTAIPEESIKDNEDKVPSPSVSPTPITKLHADYAKDSGEDMELVVQKDFDLDNQPDVVKSSQRAVSLPCSNCGHKTDDKSVSPKAVSKENAFSKSRADVITRPADTSNPQLDVDSHKPESDNVQDIPEVVDASSPKSDSADIANRASPASVCSMTIGQSGMASEEASRSPISDTSQDKDMKPPVVNKPPPILSRPSKKTQNSARDKAKSINSIIKRIEERNLGLNSTKRVENQTTQPSVVTLPQPSKTTMVKQLETNSTSPTTISKVNSSKVPKPSKTPPAIHPAFASAMAAQGIIPKTISQQITKLPPQPVPMDTLPPGRPATKRERTGNGRGRGAGKRTQSPGSDCTPIKRMRQMCNGIVDNPQAKSKAGLKAGMYPQVKGQTSASPLTQYGRSPQHLPKPLDPRTAASVDQRTMASMDPRTALMTQAHLHSQLQARAQASTSARSPHHPTTSTSAYPAKPRDHYSVPPAHMNNQPSSPTSGISLNNNRSATPISNIHPAHTHHTNSYKPYYGEYAVTNPRANGYDEPLELTTKPSRDRKLSEEPRGRGSFLKIPSLVKP